MSGADDDQLQRAALERLLDLGLVTLDELTRDLRAETGPYSEHDPIAQAVRDLVRDGLVHRHDEFVMPTRAAVRFNELVNA